MSERCPSDLALERYLVKPAGSPWREHVRTCAGCSQRLRGMDEVGREFSARVYPATRERVLDRVAAAERPSWQRWGWWVAPALAAAAAALVLTVNVAPAPDYVGLKGAGLGLKAYVGGGAQPARAVQEGEPVPADAQLRFEVSPAATCHLWLVSVDGAGVVSRLYPAEGTPGARLERAGALPGGVALDGRPGPERLYAVCTTEPIPFEQVAAAVRQGVPAGDGAVRQARPLPGLPPGSTQASLLLEKVR